MPRERNTGHPAAPASNIAKIGAYDPNLYYLAAPTNTVVTSEDLLANRPPCLTQKSIALYLKPLTYELDESPPRPMIADLPEAVIDRMVKVDKAFWVDKPGLNAYNLHDTYYNYYMPSELVLPPHQDVFPRSYQYDLDCVKYRRQHACDGLNEPDGPNKKPISAHCRDCRKLNIPALSPFQLAWIQDSVQKRWRYYPDVSSKMTDDEIKKGMAQVGRPFQNEACNWYNKNYPSMKYNVILRKFSH